jgi:hypothetical protein
MAAMSRARSRSQGPASVYRQTPELDPQTQASLNATSTGTSGAEAPPAAGGNPSGIGFPTTMAPPDGGPATHSPRMVDNPTFPQFGPIPPNGGFQAPVDPNTVVTPPAAPPATPNPAWNTNGYAPPGYTAANPYSAPSGWDATKWADPNHQSPKYVVGRILQEASGGTGALRDQAQRDAAIAKILQAYPGAKFDGKDKVTFPDGGVVDIFGGAGAGQYTAAWMPVTGPGGAALPQGGGGMAQSPQGWTLPYPQAGGDLGNANPGGLNPNGMPFYGADILRYLAQQLGLQNVLGGQIGQR